MKICILSAFEDSMMKESGASVRIYNIAKGLATSGHDVQVVMPGNQTSCGRIDGVTVFHIAGFFPITILKFLKRIVDVKRPTALYFFDLLFILRVSQLTREEDIIQIEQSSSGGLLIPFIKRIMRKRIIIDCHDVFQALRVKHTSLYRKILETFLEKISYNNADLLLVVSDTEKKRLISFGFPKSKIVVVPNGVDTNYFRKTSDIFKTKRKLGLDGFRAVIFVGSLSYVPNREAVQLLSSVIAPKVSAKISNVKFLVVGKLQSQMTLPRLVFTGFVDDLPAVLSISDVAVAPLIQGSGTRLKILEYFSCGLPVVSTSIGAEGLDVTNGINIFIEDDLDNFAHRIIELLENKELSASIGQAARELAKKTYDWQNITTKLENAYLSILAA